MTYYVDIHQPAGGDGSRSAPFSAIAQAAAVAVAGDEIIVAPGVYREEVVPPRGGSDEEHRIVYRSEVPGAAVISGAEELTCWEPVEAGIWRAVIDNRVFHGDNPFADTVRGDWYYFSEETPVHRGDVYLDGKSMYEVFSLEQLRRAEPSPWSWDAAFSVNQWYACVGEAETEVYVRLAQGSPREHVMEYSVRRHGFYPAAPEVNYITLSGFTVCMAAPQWAPPTAYQEGMIGPHWAKGWIIEGCHIYESKCVGISLGKYLQPENENKWITAGWKHGTQNERDAICQAWNEGWSRETVGGHIIRDCDIHDCGQAGIAGHLGCVFSLIERNHIHHINNKQELNGAEIGGIKLHAAIDVTIRRNHIHHCTRGLWLDWQAQGTRVTDNAFHHNQPAPGSRCRTQLCFGEDIFIEVSHGPTLIDNNLLLSACAARISTQGIAFAHNLIAGSFTFVGAGTNNAGLDHPESVRYTPYHVRHGTAVAGFMSILHGDAKFYNNVFIQQPVLPEWTDYIAAIGKDRLIEMNMRAGTLPYSGYPTPEAYRAMFTPQRIAGDRTIYYKPLPVWCEGNVYCNGAEPTDLEQDAPRLEGVTLALAWEGDTCRVTTNLYRLLDARPTRMITTGVLGMAFEPEQPYENPDGTPLRLDRDLSGAARSEAPLPGPWEPAAEDAVRVWAMNA